MQSPVVEFPPTPVLDFLGREVKQGGYLLVAFSESSNLPTLRVGRVNGFTSQQAEWSSLAAPQINIEWLAVTGWRGMAGKTTNIFSDRNRRFMVIDKPAELA